MLTGGTFLAMMGSTAFYHVPVRTVFQLMVNHLISPIPWHLVFQSVTTLNFFFCRVVKYIIGKKCKV